MDPIGKVLTVIFKGVLAESLEGNAAKKARGDDAVCINIISPDGYPAACRSGYS